MTVRERTGRVRYIGFVIESGRTIDRRELEAALAEASRLLPSVEGRRSRIELTVYTRGRGILRVPHRSREQVTALVSRIGGAGVGGRQVLLRPVVTSGTICKVKRRLGLAGQGPPPARARKRPLF